MKLITLSYFLLMMLSCSKENLSQNSAKNIEKEVYELENITLEVKDSTAVLKNDAGDVVANNEIEILVEVGEKVTQKLNIKNVNVATLALDIEMPTETAEMQFKNSCSTSLGRYRSCPISITIDATNALVENEGQTLITINGHEYNIKFVVIQSSKESLENQAKTLIISTPAGGSVLDFGELRIDLSESKTQTIQLKNSSAITLPVIIDKTALVETQYSTTCGVNLERFRLCQISLKLDATDKENNIIHESITSAGKTIQISGSYLLKTEEEKKAEENAKTLSKITINPADSLNLGDLEANKIVKKQIYIKNNSSESLTLHFDLSTAPSFQILNSCPQIISRFRDCRLDVSFDSTAKPSGQLTENISIAGKSYPLLVNVLADMSGPQTPLAGEIKTYFSSSESTSVDFGTTQYNNYMVRQIEVKNTTMNKDLLLNIGDLQQDSRYIKTTTCLPTLPINSSCFIDIYFEVKPEFTSGQKTESLQISDINFSIISNIEALPQDPSIDELSITPFKQINFIDINQDSQSQQSITIQNITSKRLNIRVSELNNNAFALNNSCPSVIAPYQTCLMNITFNPSNSLNVGTYVDSFLISDIERVDLMGNTIPVIKDPAPGDLLANKYTINFGTVEALESKNESIEITNTRPYALNLNFGGNPIGYTVSLNTCSNVIQVAETCSIDVVFNQQPNTIPPTIYSGVINISDWISVSVTGEVLDPYRVQSPLEGDLELSANEIDFGNVELGQESPNNITVTNRSNKNLFLSIDPDGDISPFVIDTINSCGSTIDMQASCPLTIKLDPSFQTSGSFSKTITISGLTLTLKVNLGSQELTPIKAFDSIPVIKNIGYIGHSAIKVNEAVYFRVQNADNTFSLYKQTTSQHQNGSVLTLLDTSVMRALSPTFFLYPVKVGNSVIFQAQNTSSRNRYFKLDLATDTISVVSSNPADKQDFNSPIKPTSRAVLNDKLYTWMYDASGIAGLYLIKDSGLPTKITFYSGSLTLDMIVFNNTVYIEGQGVSSDSDPFSLYKISGETGITFVKKFQDVGKNDVITFKNIINNELYINAQITENGSNVFTHFRMATNESTVRVDTDISQPPIIFSQNSTQTAYFFNKASASMLNGIDLSNVGEISKIDILNKSGTKADNIFNNTFTMFNEYIGSNKTVNKGFYVGNNLYFNGLGNSSQSKFFMKFNPIDESVEKISGVSECTDSLNDSNVFYCSNRFYKVDVDGVATPFKKLNKGTTLVDSTFQSGYSNIEIDGYIYVNVRIQEDDTQSTYKDEIYKFSIND